LWRLVPIILLVAVAWILVFAGAYIVFTLIVPLQDFFAGLQGTLFTSTVKALLATALVLAWVAIMIQLRNLYVRRRLYGYRTPST
jgi:hypothetical protein